MKKFLSSRIEPKSCRLKGAHATAWSISPGLTETKAYCLQAQHPPDPKECEISQNRMRGTLKNTLEA